jgi:hypothetical protein
MQSDRARLGRPQALALSTLEQLNVDAVALFAFAEMAPVGGVGDLFDWRLDGRIAHSMQAGVFKATPGEVLWVPAPQRLKHLALFVMGLGARQALTTEGFSAQIVGACEAAAKAGRRRLGIAPFSGTAPGCEDPMAAIEAVAQQTSGHIIAKVLTVRVD